MAGIADRYYIRNIITRFSRFLGNTEIYNNQELRDNSSRFGGFDELISIVRCLTMTKDDIQDSLSIMETNYTNISYHVVCFLIFEVNGTNQVVLGKYFSQGPDAATEQTYLFSIIYSTMNDMERNAFLVPEYENYMLVGCRTHASGALKLNGIILL